MENLKKIFWYIIAVIGFILTGAAVQDFLRKKGVISKIDKIDVESEKDKEDENNNYESKKENIDSENKTNVDKINNDIENKKEDIINNPDKLDDYINYDKIKASGNGKIEKIE